jgi:hypothetical protein
MNLPSAAKRPPSEAVPKFVAAEPNRLILTNAFVLGTVAETGCLLKLNDVAKMAKLSVAVSSVNLLFIFIPVIELGLQLHYSTLRHKKLKLFTLIKIIPPKGRYYFYAEWLVCADSYQVNGRRVLTSWSGVADARTERQWNILIGNRGFGSAEQVTAVGAGNIFCKTGS